MSQHPTDLPIRALVDTGRAASAADVAATTARIAAAPLTTDSVRVRVEERGAVYEQIVLTDRVSANDYHRVKRVVLDEQWAKSTTATQYRDDLHRAAQHPAARLAVYRRRGSYSAATRTQTNAVMLPAQLGRRPEPLFVVVYSDDRGMSVSGYLATREATVSIPGDALVRAHGLVRWQDERRGR